jgi:hypothetical protein
MLSVVIAVGTLAGCTPPSNDAAPTSTGATAEAVTQPPRHNWSYREGDSYGYVPVLSDDQKRAGQGAADVQMFRFLGVHDGLYFIGAEGDTVAYCSNPCEVVKVVEGNQMTRVAFSSRTVIGAVLQDAFNGQLDQTPPNTRRSRGSRD